MSKSIIIGGLIGAIVGNVAYRAYEYYKTRKQINDSLKETVKGMKECNMFH